MADMPTITDITVEWLELTGSRATITVCHAVQLLIG